MESSSRELNRCAPEKETVVLTPPPPKKKQGHPMQKVDRVGISWSKLKCNI